MGRLEALDELRGLATASVLLSHLGLVFGRDATVASVLSVPAFGVGVDLFFVISGFVIVQNVHASREAAVGEFWRGAMAFWARRVLRIALPAWATIAAIALWASGASIADLEAAAGFYGNFHWAPCFAGAGDCGDALATSHFWSLAVEMQFYAVAPLLGALSVHQTRVVAAALLLSGALTPRPWGGFLMGVQGRWSDDRRAPRARAAIGGVVVRARAADRSGPCDFLVVDRGDAGARVRRRRFWRWPGLSLQRSSDSWSQAA